MKKYLKEKKFASNPQKNANFKFSIIGWGTRNDSIINACINEIRENEEGKNFFTDLCLSICYWLKKHLPSYQIIKL